MAELISLANIRGPEGKKGNTGDIGPRGLPGANAIPANNAVAEYIRAEDSETRVALDENFVTAVSTEHGTTLYMNGVAL